VTTANARPGTLLLAGAHAGQAAILLAQPPSVLRTVAGDQDVPPPWILRVLGVRLLVQATAEMLSPRPTTLRISAFVDLSHAASMFLAAKAWPRYRRAALLSAASATSAAVAATAGARHGR
jgi:hypothetical protein